MSIVATIPGTAGVILPGAPKINLSPLYRKLAKLPGLRVVIDPASLNVNSTGRDIKSGGHIYPGNSSKVVKVDSDPAFNGRPVMEMLSVEGGLFVEGVRPTPSFTVICVGAQDETTHGPGSNTANLFTQVWPGVSPTGDRYGSYLATGTSGLRLTPRYGDPATAPYIAYDMDAGNTPSPGEVGLWAASLDIERLEVVYLWRRTLFYRVNIPNTLVPLTQDELNSTRWHYAGPSPHSTTLGTKGKFGMALIFDIPLGRQSYLPIFEDVVGLLREEYAIAA